MLAWLGAGLGLAVLTLACGPSTSPAQPSPSADAFAVVRATSQAAYQSGQAALARGDYLQACVDLDTAKTTDPDNRPEIQQALEQALTRCLTPPPAATSPPAAAQQRTLVVATIAAGVGSGLGGTPAAALTGVATVVAPPLNIATTTEGGSPSSVNITTLPRSSTSATGSQTAVASADATLVNWNDPQGRFSIGAPADWTTTSQPPTLVGNGIVQFHDPSGRAEMDVAVDSSSQAVSPERYAAKLELAMQQQVLGYAGEQVVPGNTSGSPSIERVFTFNQKDASSQDHQVRGLQVVVVKGSTPYIISASAPAEQYQQFSSTFDRILASFKFS